jgi:hypothetical protein
MVRRRQRRAARDIRRNRQRPELIAMLEAHDLIFDGDIGQSSNQLACVLWDPALPVGIQASVYRDSHTIPNIVSAAQRQGLRMFRPMRQSASSLHAADHGIADSNGRLG